MKAIFNKIKLVLMILNLLFQLPIQAQEEIHIPTLLDTLEAYSKQHKYPGVMLSIVQSDTILFSGGFGYANIEKKEEVSKAHIFRQGSISKSITALALIKLIKDKGLRLDTPIKEIIPKLPYTNKWAAHTPITVAHILEHTTGFDGWHTHAIYNLTDSLAPPTSTSVHAHRKSFESRWQPGTRHAYSNPTYVIAGHLIEVLAEQPYHEYIKQHILEPLGMHKSGFYFNAPKTPFMSQGYNYESGAFVNVPFARIQGGAAGNFCANAEDMATFLQFMLNRNGNLIDATTFTDAMFDRIENSETTLAAKKGLRGGYGLGNFSTWQNGYEFHGHNGGISGYSSRYIYSPEANLGIAVATNTTKDISPLVEVLLELMLGKKTQPKANRVTMKIPDSLKEKYEGFYVVKNLRLKLRGPIMQFVRNFHVDFMEDKVYIKDILGGVRDSLAYAGNNKFYRNIQDVPSVLFFETEEAIPAVGVKRDYAEKSSLSRFILINGSILLSMILSFLYPAYFGICFLIQLIKKKKLITKEKIVLFLTCLSFPIMFFSFGMAISDRVNAGNFTPFSATLFVASISLVALVLWSIYNSFKLSGTKTFKAYYILTTIAMLIITLFFAHHEFIGMRMWNY